MDPNPTDAQKEAEAEGINKNGKFQHSLAGLKRVPEDGFYRYRTNPNPETDPWIITGAMKVNRILTNEEVDDLVRKAGREPQEREPEVRFSRITPEQDKDIRFSFSSSVKEFNEMRDKVVAENGLVADGLNNVTFQIHPMTVNNYDGVSSEKVVKDFAKGKKFPIEDKHPDGFPFYISKDSLSEFVNKGQIDKSVEGGATRNIRLSLLPEMVDVIKKSIEVEIHPDYKKVGDERKPENGYNDDVLMHRLYGAIEADGKVYRVKTTLKEYRDKNKDNKAYAYEVTKIELIDKPSDGVQKDSSRPSAPVNNSISGANLLRDVEKSYDPGKKLLDVEYLAAVESGDMAKAQKMMNAAFKSAFPNTKVVYENGEPLVVYHGAALYGNNKRFNGSDTDGPHDEFIPKNANQIKSADPVTYDDNGNIIPLSERFNESNPDIQFSKGKKESI